jgi:hypothetical protein
MKISALLKYITNLWSFYIYKDKVTDAANSNGIPKVNCRAFG